VNFPALSLEKSAGNRIVIVNENVTRMLGQILSILADKDINVLDMLNKSRDDIAYNLIDVETPLSEETLNEIKSIEHVIKVWMI
jgi:D-3-phosphoglycerate dehydrogenase